MFKPNKVNSTSQFRDFENKLKDIAKYNSIKIDDKTRLDFIYESGPATFVNYCFIKVQLVKWDCESELWEDSFGDWWNIASFPIQNYNMSEALKKAKELINYWKKNQLNLLVQQEIKRK